MAHPGVLDRKVHSDGHTDVCFSGDGRLVISCGSDNIWAVEVDQFNDGTMATVDHHTSSVVRVISNDAHVVSGDDAGTVAHFTLPKLAFQANVVRNTLSINDLALDASGTFVAVIGENFAKVVNLHDTTQMFIIPGELKGLMRSAAFDPQQRYLAIAADDGHVRMWTYEEERKCEATVKAFPPLQNDDNLCRVSWHPSGDFVAAAGAHDVAIIDRKTWTVLTTLKDEHKEPVSIVAWSPNGRYLATVDLSGTIMTWQWMANERRAECLDRLKQGKRVTGLAWSPTDNSLVFASILGIVSMWSNVIDLSAKHPHPATADMQSTQPEAPAVPIFEDDSDGESERPKLLSLGKRKVGGDDDISKDEVNGEDENEDNETKHKQAKRRETRERAVGKRYQYEPSEDLDHDGDQDVYETEGLDSLMQPPFQPGSTEDSEMKKRRYLVWNMIGMITTRKDVGYNDVTIEFHDKGLHRPMQQTDYFQSTLAAMNEHAAVFACQRREGEKDTDIVPSTMSVILFDSWTSTGNWQVQMDPHENIDAITLGSTWFACASDQLYVRLFSVSGIQTFVFSVPGRCVSMSGNNDTLFVVYHRAVPPAGTQYLDFLLMNVVDRKVLHRGNVPLHPEAKLDWIGFSESKMPVVFDSQGVLRGLVTSMDYTWTPLLDTRMPPHDADRLNNYFWPVGVTDSELLFVLCKGAREPAVVPRPVITTVSLSVPPLTGHDMRLSDLCLQQVLTTEKIQSKLLSAAEMMDTDKKDDARAFVHETDIHLLKLVLASCVGDKDLRALDVCSFLSGPKAIDAAIQIAIRKKRANLVERMHELKKARFRATSVISENDRPVDFDEEPKKKAHVPVPAVADVAEMPTVIESVVPKTRFSTTAPTMTDETPSLPTRPIAKNPFAKTK